MEPKGYKKIYGSVLFELQQNGFDIELDKFEQFSQFFTINNKYLRDFYFVLTVDYHYSNSGKTSVFMYCVPKYMYNYADIDTLRNNCWLRHLFIMDADLNIVNTKNLVKFIKNFKKNKKYYFYNAMIDDYAVNKKVNKRTIRKFYKKFKKLPKPQTMIKPTNL